MSDAINLDRIDYRAGGFQLADLSLTVPTGSIYGFLGPNGAGKTTTIRLMLGLLRPTAGAVTLLGHRIPHALTAALRGTGYVPERPHLHPFLTVAESIDLHAAFHDRFDRRWAADLSRSFGLAADRPLARLSKGEMGKLLMLQALCQRPDLLILDEPTDGLDPVVRRDVLGALVDYVAEHGATVFISSHLVHELERLCDWVGMMDKGRLVAEMPMERLKNGIKRLRMRGPMDRLTGAPFEVLSRSGRGTGAAIWVVDQWEADMTEWIGAQGVTIDRVEDLDLEEGFVERLRARREEVACA